MLIQQLAFNQILSSLMEATWTPVLILLQSSLTSDEGTVALFSHAILTYDRTSNHRHN